MMSTANLYRRLRLMTGAILTTLVFLSHPQQNLWVHSGSGKVPSVS
jgi:hypothetical protein